MTTGADKVTSRGVPADGGRLDGNSEDGTPSGSALTHRSSGQRPGIGRHSDPVHASFAPPQVIVATMLSELVT